MGTLSDYTVLIRTFNCSAQLRQVLTCLDAQTHKPARLVVIDSGSTDDTLSIVDGGAVVQPYVGREFNYSAAINQGLRHVTTPYVLILSSHSLLTYPGACEVMARMLDDDENVGAAYATEAGAPGEVACELIDRCTFDGFNGLWNTCAMIRMDLLARRQFREDVFAAEDQEWAAWLFRTEGKQIARLQGVGFRNINPRKHSIRKRLNDYVAVAYFTRPELLEAQNLLRILHGVLLPGWFPALRERYFRLRLAWRLFLCRLRPPAASSRYF
jgi:glycosyltransferase involved in cell wall biosynthesis